MANKIQGEGDYESARHFNKQERQFVKKGVGRQRALNDREELEGRQAEEKGKARARDAGQDAKDAELFRKNGSAARRH